MILVTGASGFLGQHLVRFLANRGLQVRALYNNNPPGATMRQLPNVTWAKYDLLDIYDVEDAMVNITDVYHCAAIVSFDPAVRDQMLHFNAESTANIVNQALEQGIRKMAYVSSVAALGRTKANKEITEEQEWEESNRNSAYGLSKYLGEMEVWRGCGEGMKAIIVNPGIILGAGDDFDKGSAHLMQVVYKQFPFYTAGVTSWVDVKDVVTALYELMQSETDAERFILSAGNFAFRDIFTRMAQALHKKPPHIRAGSLLTEIVWRWSMLKNRFTHSHNLITRETARSAQGLSYYNNQKLYSFLPAFQYTPIDITINTMAQSFLENLKNN